MSTLVPPITWVNGAPVLPTESAILAGELGDLNNAFGGGLNTTNLQTPQGQLAQTLAAIIGDKNNQIAYISNQVNPSMSSGIWQDAIGYIYGMTRIAAAGTIVQATCVGAVGTVIPAGSVAQDSNGYLYSSTASATIPAGGSVTIQFQNQTAGAIACNIGALNTIYSAIAGWNTITNASDGILGNLVESRAAFELRRQQSVAANSVNSNSAILGAVYAVPNVLSAYVIDNPTNSALSYGSTSYSIAANSLVVSVAGGTSSAIGQAIWSKKPPGIPLVGNTSVTVYDTNYPTPYPSYSITYLTPTNVNVYFAVQLKNNAQLPSNIVSLVQSAIVASFNGQDGGTAAGINQITYAGRYYANIAAQAPSVEILSVLIGFTNIAGATNTSLTFGIDQMPITSTSNVGVTLV